MAILPGDWYYRVSAGTGRPGVSILWLGEMESLICSFHLSVAARKIVCADPSLRYTPPNNLVGLVVKASASRAEDPGFESRLRRDFSGVESYQWLKNWHSSDYPARRLAL